MLLPEGLNRVWRGAIRRLLYHHREGEGSGTALQYSADLTAVQYSAEDGASFSSAAHCGRWGVLQQCSTMRYSAVQQRSTMRKMRYLTAQVRYSTVQRDTECSTVRTMRYTSKYYSTV